MIVQLMFTPVLLCGAALDFEKPNLKKVRKIRFMQLDICLLRRRIPLYNIRFIFGFFIFHDVKFTFKLSMLMFLVYVNFSCLSARFSTIRTSE